MSHLDGLERHSVHIIREARATIPRLALLWSLGKDSTVLLHLVRKAFLGAVPLPVLHIDTTKKIPEMIAWRDRVSRELGLELIVATNTDALAGGMGPERGRVTCCTSLKTDALRQAVEAHGLQGLLLGIRRDEEGTRSKERVFSPRGDGFQWDVADQPPELWDQYHTDVPRGGHVRVHPLLGWTELDVWEYIVREQIPVVDLYFSREGRRYRSLGCVPCTGSIASTASTPAEILEELRRTRQGERAGRAQDREAEDAFERLRVTGYM